MLRSFAVGVVGSSVCTGRVYVLIRCICWPGVDTVYVQVRFMYHGRFMCWYGVFTGQVYLQRWVLKYEQGEWAYNQVVGDDMQVGLAGHE